MQAEELLERLGQAEVLNDCLIYHNHSSIYHVYYSEVKLYIKKINDWCSWTLRVEDFCLALQHTNVSERLFNLLNSWLGWKGEQILFSWMTLYLPLQWFTALSPERTGFFPGLNRFVKYTAILVISAQNCFPYPASSSTQPGC